MNANRIEAENYVRSIRNKAKREYAEKYMASLFDGKPGVPVPASLSYMGAQAVRIALGLIHDNVVSRVVCGGIQ